MSDSELLTLTLMSYFGQSPISWPINMEIGDLGPLAPAGGELFRFRRYDVLLEKGWLREALGVEMEAALIARLRPMDDPRNMPLLFELARNAAERQVRPEHLRFVDSSVKRNG